MKKGKEKKKKKKKKGIEAFVEVTQFVERTVPPDSVKKEAATILSWRYVALDIHPYLKHLVESSIPLQLIFLFVFQYVVPSL